MRRGCPVILPPPATHYFVPSSGHGSRRLQIDKQRGPLALRADYQGAPMESGDESSASEASNTRENEPRPAGAKQIGDLVSPRCTLTLESKRCGREVWT